MSDMPERFLIPIPESERELYVTDEELIRRLGVPRKAARAALHMFDRDRSKGFPQKQALWGNRRFWPAVEAYFYRTNGLKLDTPTTRRQA